MCRGLFLGENFLRNPKTHKNVQILKKYTEDFVEKTVVSKLHSKCPEEHSAKKKFCTEFKYLSKFFMTLNEQYSVFRLRANNFRQGLQSCFYVSRGTILKKKNYWE